MRGRERKIHRERARKRASEREKARACATVWERETEKMKGQRTNDSTIGETSNLRQRGTRRNGSTEASGGRGPRGSSLRVAKAPGRLGG